MDGREDRRGRWNSYLDLMLTILPLLITNQKKKCIVMCANVNSWFLFLQNHLHSKCASKLQYTILRLLLCVNNFVNNFLQFWIDRRQERYRNFTLHQIKLLEKFFRFYFTSNSIAWKVFLIISDYFQFFRLFLALADLTHAFIS